MILTEPVALQVDWEGGVLFAGGRQGLMRCGIGDGQADWMLKGVRVAALRWGGDAGLAVGSDQVRFAFFFSCFHFLFAHCLHWRGQALYRWRGGEWRHDWVGGVIDQPVTALEFDGMGRLWVGNQWSACSLL